MCARAGTMRMASRTVNTDTRPSTPDQVEVVDVEVAVDVTSSDTYMARLPRATGQYTQCKVAIRQIGAVVGDPLRSKPYDLLSCRGAAAGEARNDKHHHDRYSGCHVGFPRGAASVGAVPVKNQRPMNSTTVIPIWIPINNAASNSIPVQRRAG